MIIDRGLTDKDNAEQVKEIKESLSAKAEEYWIFDS
tara:strand:- start:83 stop:190 length:108 start_codon:yes stop_codon:yes gene_type:complete